MSEQVVQGTRVAKAARIKRPGWKDPRLALGAVLVIASVAGTMYLVSEMHETTTVYVARSNITLGEQLTADNMKTQEVQLGETAGRYLQPDSDIDKLARANTFVSAGELIPVTSVTHSELGSRRPINVELPADLTSSIGPGSFVDVWIAKRESGETRTVSLKSFPQWLRLPHAWKAAGDWLTDKEPILSCWWSQTS